MTSQEFYLTVVALRHEQVTNGPKKAELERIVDEEIRRVQAILNNRAVTILPAAKELIEKITENDK